MIRSKYVFASAVVFLLLAVSCLRMLVNHCPMCTFYWLRTVAIALIGTGGLAGIAIFGVTLWRTQRLWHMCRLTTTVGPPTLQQVCQRLGLTTDQITCIQHPDPASFCLGLLRPKIVVSTGLVEQVSARELAAILVHERHHQRQRDPLRMLAMRCVQTVLYPFPAIHDFHRAFLALIEIEADEAAVGIIGRSALAGALYKMLAISTEKPVSPFTAVTAQFCTRQSRVAYLLDPHHSLALPLSISRLVVSLLPFLLLCLGMFMF